MVAKKKTATQKRVLDDPGDVSISLAPAPAKKAKAPAQKKKGTKATANPQGPSPGPVPSAPTASDAEAALATPPAPAPAPAPAKARPRPVGKPTEAPAPPTNEPGPDVPAVETAHPESAPKSSKRGKKPSEIAQKVQAQEAAKQQVKDQKAQRKAKKDEAAVIVETPEETAAFVERLEATHITPAASSITASPRVSAPAKPRRQTSVDHRKAMGQLINAHRPSPAPSTASGLSLASSATSSLAPSESVSQRGAAIRKEPKPKPANSQPPLQLPPSLADSRDVSPAAESVMTVDEDDDEGPLATSGFDLHSILEGIPEPFVVELRMPEPLPGPLHIMRRRPDLPAHDYTHLKGPERQREKRRQEASRMSALRPRDQPVAKLAIERMDILLATCCAFPDDDTSWILSNLSNNYASLKLGRNYELTRGSEYEKLLRSRISQSRGKFDTDALESNRNHIRDLLHNAAFTCPSFAQGNQLYEHPFFEQLLKHTLFATPSSKGLVNPDILKTITLPLMALIATATEKFIMAYSTGSFQKPKANSFSATTFMPKYYSHLLTLAHMYRSNKKVLSGYLNQLFRKLRAPHAAALAAQNPTSIRAAVPLSFVSQQYAARTMSDAPASASTTVSSTPPSSIPSGSSHRQPVVASHLQSTLASVINNKKLTDEEKANILRHLITAGQHDDGPTTSTSAAHTYGGLLTEVNGGDSDSEVEARRAGAIPSARVREKMAAEAWGDEEDDSAESEEEGEGGETGEGEAESEAEEHEVEEHEAEEHEAEEVEEAAAEAEGLGHGQGGDSDGDNGQAEGDDSDAIVVDDSEPTKRVRNFFPTPGDHSGPELDSDDSDGEGASGAVRRDHAVLADGDLTMASVASIE